MPYIGKQLSNGNYLKLDDISSQFNGSKVTFSLTNGGSAYYPGSEFSILVSVGGVIQEPESAYQISNDEITFANAPTAQDSFFCVVLGDAIGINVPGNNTVNGTQMAKPFNYDGGLLYLDDANNKVGINSISPSVALDVVGDLKVTGNITGIGGTLGGTLIGNVYASSGISTFNDLRVTNNLTVEGTTTTLDTNLVGVDRIEVGANSNTVVGVAITQSGTADILQLFDGTSKVVTVDDEGKVGIGTASPDRIIHAYESTNNNLLFLESGDTNVDIIQADTGGSTRIRNSQGSLVFYVNGDASSNSAANAVTGLTIDGDKDVHVYDDLFIPDKIVHEGDTNTAIRFPADDVISFERGGGEALRITTANALLTAGVTAEPLYPHYTTARKIQAEIKGAIDPANTRHHGSLAVNCTNSNSFIGLVRSDNTQTDGTDIGVIGWTGFDGTDFHQAAAIMVKKGAGAGNDNQPGHLIFKTNSGTTSATERLRITSDGTSEFKGDVKIRNTGGVSLFSLIDANNESTHEFGTPGNGDLRITVDKNDVASGQEFQLYMRGNDAADLAFHIDHDRNVKMPNGKVGVGTNNPVGNLEVRDTKSNFIVAKTGLTVKANSDLHTSYDFIQLGAGGALASYSVATATADTQFIHNAYRSSGGNWKYRYADTAMRFRMNSPGNTFIFESAASGSADADITFSEKVRITSAGNLKIPDDAKIELGGVQTGSGDFQIYHDGGDNYISGTGNHATIFKTNGAERLRIRSDSNITQTIDTDGDGFIITAGDMKPMLTGNSNRSAHNNTIFGISGKWNNTEVGRIAFEAGADTTNKDDGKINFYTRVSGGHLLSRLLIDSDGILQVKTTKASGYVAEFNQLHTSNSAQILINSPTDSNSRPVLMDFARAGTIKWSAGMGYNDAYNGFHICSGASLSSGTANSKFVVTSDGYTGIGNYAGARTTPVTSLLHVSTNWDNGDVPMVHFQGCNNESPTSGTNNISFQITDENNSVLHKIWNTGGGDTDLGKVYYAGKMGIGPAAGNPSEQLYVSKNHNGHTRAVIQNNWGSNATAQLKLISPTDEFQLIKYASGDASINLSNDADINFSINGSERFIIHNDGTLELKNNSGKMIDCRTSSGTGNCWISLNKSDGTNKGYFGYGSSSNEQLYIVQQESADITIYNGSASRWYFKTDGQLNSATDGAINVYGGANHHTNDAVIYVDKTSNADWTIAANAATNDYGIYTRVGNGAAYGLGVYDHTNSAWRFRVNGAGTIYATNTTVQGISDQRLKENIVDANSQWDDIKALRFVNYKWKADSGYADGKTYLGLISQEVETISPGLVEINAQTKEDIENGVPDPEYKNVKYSIVWMKAMKALQEAQARIETLEAKVATLEGS